ncbi:MAG: magnesium chelatase [Clostridiales bacterium]|nr:MAG: magnesium chelatase [Clostridiales bacterium]
MEYQETAKTIVKNINKALIGKENVVELAVVTLLSQGHLLLEDVPGVGKTTLANALAKSINCGFSRIQFTPDTLPGDVTGLTVYNMKTGTFEFSKGAVMSNIILADEINRTSPKTQAALLEAMQERQVTVDGKTYPLESPFMVIATQNPVDFLGTYNLPEAQLDRFLMKLSVGYPSAVDENIMAQRYLAGERFLEVETVADKQEVIAMQAEVEQIYVAEPLVSYIVSITAATREHVSLTLGASPRATLALTRTAQAVAYMAGRDYVIPDDIQRLIPHVLGHRLVPSVDARIQRLSPQKILAEIVRSISVPILPSRSANS